MDSKEVRVWLTKRQGHLEEALRDFGKKPPKSMSQEEVVTWLKFRAQQALIVELLNEV